VRSSKYNAAVLGPIVQSSRTLAEVLRRLGLRASGGNYRYIAARIRQAGLESKHFRTQSFAARCAVLSRETLADLVAHSTSIAQVLVKLQMPPEGRSHRELTRRLRELEIDTKHLRGRGWSRGETRGTHPSVERVSQLKSWSDSDVFTDNSPLLSSKGLTRRLLARGWSYRCAWCDVVEWRGRSLVLHLDHINGINNDNRLTNLRFLCPNCHSQTDTYGNRRRDSDGML